MTHRSETTPNSRRPSQCAAYGVAFSMLLGVLLLVSRSDAGSIFDDDWIPPKPAARPNEPAMDKPAPDPAVPANPVPPDSAPPANAPPPPAVADAPATQPESNVKPIPAKADLAAAGKLMSEVYAKELGQSAATARREFAKKLLDVASGKDLSDAERFVVIGGAIHAAEEGGSLALSFNAIEAMTETYGVDGLALKVDVTLKVATQKPEATLAAENVHAGDDLLSELETAEDLAGAKKVSGAIQKFAGADAKLRNSVQPHLREIDEMRKAHDLLAPVWPKLKANPDDADANAAVGKYVCLWLQHWERGLPMLARGSDAGLKVLAQRELSIPADEAGRLAVADGWWAEGEKETGRAAVSLRSHAADWYRLAAPDATGLARLKIEKRLDEATPKGGPARPTGAVASEAKPGRPPTWKFTVKNFCSEGSLLGHVEIPDEFTVKYANGVGQIAGTKNSDALNIGGVMRGFFGKAIIWAVPQANELNVQLRLLDKLHAGHELFVYDTDQGYDPRDGSRYHGKILARVTIAIEPNTAGVVSVQTDAKTGQTDILLDGKSLLSEPFRIAPKEPVLLVLAVFLRDAGAKADTSFTLSELRGASRK